MFGWFKKRDDRRVDELENSVRNSFSNMKTDMSHISQWIGHFKEKHGHHEKKFSEHRSEIDNLKARVSAIESLLDAQDEKVRVEDDFEQEKEQPSATVSVNSRKKSEVILTEAQKHVYKILYSLSKENPDGWVSLKSLAGEAYHNNEYHKVRSVVSQFVTVLELNGLVERKRVGKEMYVTVVKKLPDIVIDSPQSISSKKQKK